MQHNLYASCICKETRINVWYQMITRLSIRTIKKNTVNSLLPRPASLNSTLESFPSLCSIIRHAGYNLRSVHIEVCLPQRDLSSTIGPWHWDSILLSISFGLRGFLRLEPEAFLISCLRSSQFLEGTFWTVNKSHVLSFFEFPVMPVAQDSKVISSPKGIFCALHPDFPVVRYVEIVLLFLFRCNK